MCLLLCSEVEKRASSDDESADDDVVDGSVYTLISFSVFWLSLTTACLFCTLFYFILDIQCFDGVGW